VRVALARERDDTETMQISTEPPYAVRFGSLADITAM
jgi:hypothetical protein